ncbi:MAG: DUF1826 domain-containing protein [Bacteroidota bacterium]
MIRLQTVAQAGYKGITNWAIGSSSDILASIHDKHVNIAIYERDTKSLAYEIRSLLEQQVEFRASGDVQTVVSDMRKAINPKKHALVIQDIQELLIYFQRVTGSETFRLLLATINTNMCRKFHTDINDIRLLCTYSGPGTLWLTDDNINRRARSDDARIAIDEHRIQQADTGAVVLLKGAMYPHKETKAVVHRSPTIEESGEQRLLLRIDTNETINIWS